jgi:hypothetical protein
MPCGTSPAARPAAGRRAKEPSRLGSAARRARRARAAASRDEGTRESARRTAASTVPLRAPSSASPPA